jgi:hypothetical protein
MAHDLIPMYSDTKNSGTDYFDERPVIWMEREEVGGNFLTLSI